VSQASETIDGITSVEVTSQTARVNDGKVTQYHTTVTLAFTMK
jgi:flavin-binding protein dodecin